MEDLLGQGRGLEPRSWSAPEAGELPVGEPTRLPAGPIDWSRIAGPERREAWFGLAAFVEVTVRRYNLALELRPCWWQHGEAVEALTALWHVRQFSYREGAKLTDAMAWQDALYKSRGRLRDIFVSCNDGHVDSSVDSWMTNDVAASFTRMVQRDCL